VQEVDRNTREARETAGPLSRECGPSGRCVTGRKLVSMGDVKELSDSVLHRQSISEAETPWWESEVNYRRRRWPLCA